MLFKIKRRANYFIFWIFCIFFWFLIFNLKVDKIGKGLFRCAGSLRPSSTVLVYKTIFDEKKTNLQF